MEVGWSFTTAVDTSGSMTAAEHGEPHCLKQHVAMYRQLCDAFKRCKLEAAMALELKRTLHVCPLALDDERRLQLLPCAWLWHGQVHPHVRAVQHGIGNRTNLDMDGWKRVDMAGRALTASAVATAFDV
jgi:hypothetical protein